MAASGHSSLPVSTDVLVVGAGPTGLALSLALTRLGVDVTTIDLADQVRTDSRAAGVQPRTLEDLARLGAAGRLIDRGLKGSGFRVSTAEAPLAEIPFGDLDTPYPFILLVPQATTEDVLRDTLTEAGGTVLAAHRLLDFQQEFDAVAALVADPDGVVRSVRARYLVGCDGLHSGVRERTGVAFDGEREPQTYLLADVQTDQPASEAWVNFTFSPDGLLLQSALPDNVVRVVATVAPGGGTLDQAGLQQLIDSRCAPADRTHISGVLRCGPYQVSSRLAASFSDRRVFLAGDAGHVHSPAGGQGMNTGIQDAVNLAWKLAATLDGSAQDDLLSTYDAERRPNAAALLAFTGQLTSVAGIKDPDQRALRDDAIKAVAGVKRFAPSMATRLSQLDISYRHPDDDRPEPVGRRLPPDGEWATQYAWATVPQPDGTHLTVRPDGYVADVVRGH